METSRPVVVRRVPEKMNLRNARQFFADLQSVLISDRPQIVLDMAPVRSMDAAGVEVLLKSLAEAMQRDGDVKLAAVSPEAGIILELTRADRLFETYLTSTDAARSYQGFYPNVHMRHQMTAPNHIEKTAPAENLAAVATQALAASGPSLIEKVA